MNLKKYMVDVYATPDKVDPDTLKNSFVVVIDVLRASTTIATALYNGCTEILPADDIHFAFELARTLPRGSTLLGGERQGKMIDGFTLGNSPQEYIEYTVRDKAIVLTTTNGTRALMTCRKAKKVFVGSFVNMHALSGYLLKRRIDIDIVCAGTDGKASLEDMVCAGLLVEKLDEATNHFMMTRAARQALAVAQLHKHDLVGMMKKSPHGAYLEKIGFGSDLEVCARLNSLRVIPVFQQGTIRAME